MKKLHSYLSLSVAILVLFSCKKSKPEDERALIANSNAIEVSAGAGEQAMNIRGNVAWKLSLVDDPGWVTLSKQEGTGTAEVKFTFTANPALTARTANLKLESSDGTIASQTIVLTQKSHVTWGKTIKNASYEIAESVAKTTDGGTVILSTSGSGSTGSMLVTKLSADGQTVQWVKDLGNGVGRYILPHNGGYVIGGVRYAGSWSMRFVRLSGDGQTLEWDNTLGGGGVNYEIRSILATNGGYMVAGNATPNAQGEDMYLAKISSKAETIVWEKIFNKSNTSEMIMSVVETSDGYVVAGNTYVTGSYPHLYFAKVSLDGQSTPWTYTVDKGDYAEIKSLIANDGGYVFAGSYKENVYVGKLSLNGQSIAWDKSIDKGYYDYGTSIIASDGGYVVAGFSNRTNSSMFHLSKLSLDGQTLQWEKQVNANLDIKAVLEAGDGLVVGGIGNDNGKPTVYVAKIAK